MLSTNKRKKQSGSTSVKLMMLTLSISLIAAVSGCENASASGNEAGEDPNPTAASCFWFHDLTGQGAIYAYNHNGDDDCGTDVVIPSTIGGKAVVVIGEEAFLNNNLTSVTIPDTIESIETRAFQGNHLTTVELPAHTEYYEIAFDESVTVTGGTPS